MTEPSVSSLGLASRLGLGLDGEGGLWWWWSGGGSWTWLSRLLWSVSGDSGVGASTLPALPKLSSLSGSPVSLLSK